MFGSDIDGRQMRGKRTPHLKGYFASRALMLLLPESEPGVFRAAKQYGVEGRILDLATFDMTNHPWRCGGFFDAIITDPPCELSLRDHRCAGTHTPVDGVRAGAKRLGRKRELSERQKELCRLHRESPRP